MNMLFNNNKENKNEKKQIWMYAVILFTGAFIILLLTAYSQVKFQNNISDYQNKLSSQEKAKINAVTDLNSAMKENKRLNTELESLRNKLVESEQKIATVESKEVDLETRYNNAVSASDLLMTAYELFNKEDYINCAMTLKYELSIDNLSANGVKTYNELVEKSYSKASLQLYRDGYRYYKNQNYSQAIISLNRAIDFSSKNEYYVDDAYYYLATSYFRSSDFEDAKKTINTFVTNCPKSPFMRNMGRLLDKME
jgi:TolA-binding protein